MTVDNKFGTWLKQKRLQQKLSQKDLAKRIGIANSLVSLYEAGNRIPALSLCYALSDALQIDHRIIKRQILLARLPEVEDIILSEKQIYTAKRKHDVEIGGMP